MDYKHKVKIQIRFADTDMLGHVNNANFLTYMELARQSYFETILAGIVDWNKEGIILAKATVDYKRPIFLDDSLFVHIRIDQLSSKSFHISYRFVKEKPEGDELAAEGTTLMVCYDYRMNTSIVMPDAWRAKIAEFEGIPTGGRGY